MQFLLTEWRKFDTELEQFEVTKPVFSLTGFYSKNLTLADLMASLHSISFLIKWCNYIIPLERGFVYST